MQGVCQNRSLHSSPPPRGVQRLSQQTSCASPVRQSALRHRVQVSNPKVPGLKIEHACVDHSDRSDRWGLSTQTHPVFDNAFRLSHTCCFMCRLSLRLQVVSCILLCALAQTTTCSVTKSLEVYLANVDVSCTFVVTVVHSGQGRFDVRQLWDDQHWLGQIC